MTKGLEARNRHRGLASRPEADGVDEYVSLWSITESRTWTQKRLKRLISAPPGRTSHESGTPTTASAGRPAVSTAPSQALSRLSRLRPKPGLTERHRHESCNRCSGVNSGLEGVDPRSRRRHQRARRDLAELQSNQIHHSRTRPGARPILRPVIDSLDQAETRFWSGDGSHLRQMGIRTLSAPKQVISAPPQECCSPPADRINGVPVSTAGTRKGQTRLSLSFQRREGPWTPCPDAIGQEPLPT
ncbi:hypothetical protein BBFGKLBO_02490 [Synechococcus sp. CBW1107]|nr:hypothetical protein BBFGKLBO_02490 [Synechococcus sp. CBW1107]